MDVALDHHHALLEIHRHAPQIVRIDLDAGALHSQQHGQQPTFHLLVHRQAGVESQPRPQRLPQPQRHIGIFRGIGGGTLDRHQLEWDAIATGAGDLVVAERRMAEMELR